MPTLRPVVAGDVCVASGAPLPAAALSPLQCFVGSSLPLADASWVVPPQPSFPCASGFCASWSTLVNVSALNPPHSYMTPLRAHGFRCNETVTMWLALNESNPGYASDLRLCNTPGCNTPASDTCVTEGIPDPASTRAIAAEIWLLNVAAIPACVGIALVVLIAPCILRDNSPTERRGVRGTQWVWALLSATVLTLGAALIVAGTLLPSLGAGASLGQMAPKGTDGTAKGLFYCNGIWCAAAPSEGGAVVLSPSLLRAFSSGTVTVYLGTMVICIGIYIMASTASAMRNGNLGPGVPVAESVVFAGLLVALSGGATTMLEGSSGVFAGVVLLMQMNAIVYPDRAYDPPPPPTLEAWLQYGEVIMPVGFACVVLGMFLGLLALQWANIRTKPLGE